MRKKGTTGQASFVVSPQVLASHISSWMNELTLPGLAVALIQNSHIAWVEGFGSTNIEARVSITGDTAFQSASLSITGFRIRLTACMPARPTRSRSSIDRLYLHT